MNNAILKVARDRHTDTHRQVLRPSDARALRVNWTTVMSITSIFILS